MGVSPGTKACKVFSSCRSSGACWPAGPFRAFQRKGPLVHAGSVFGPLWSAHGEAEIAFHLGTWDRPGSFCFWTALVLNAHGRDGDEDFVVSSCKKKTVASGKHGLWVREAAGVCSSLGWVLGAVL